jgi:predicted small lipoprotein YifL
MKFKSICKILAISVILSGFSCGIKGRPLPPSDNIVIVNQIQTIDKTKKDLPLESTESKEDGASTKNKLRKTKK